ncbi:MAG: AAA family ATPase [Gemmatimonadetes bacterium]|nr:AAA family ATPase [Gemmatimonadota bacterium]
MAPFRLSCLGPPVLYGPDGDPIRFRTRKHFALLLYLAVEPGIPHRRDRLATLLWSGADVDEARHSLATALSMIRGRLGAELLDTDRDTVRLMPGRIVTDLQGLDLADPDELDEGPLGPFLEEFDIPDAVDYQQWKDGQHARLLPSIHTAMASRIEQSRRRGDSRRMEALGHRLQRIDELSEEAARAVLEARAMAGDRIGALRSFDRWRARLADELGAHPSAQLERMAERLRRGGWQRPTIALLAPVPTEQWKERSFIGRGAEFRTCYDRWERVQRGEVQHLLVRGESGIGKTTLVERLTTSMALEGASVARVQCYELERELPFGVTGSLVNHLLDLPGASATPPEQLAELGRLTAKVRQRYPSLPAPIETSGESARILYTEAVMALVGAVAEDHPVVLVIDDIHLADATSLTVLHLMLRRLEALPLMVMLTASSAPEAETPSTRRFFDNAASLSLLPLALGPLSEAESAELLELLLTEAGDPGPAIRRAVLAGGRGNPMVLELLVGDWRRRGDGCLALSVSAMTPRAERPPKETFQRLVEGTLAALNGEERSVVELAAILGQRLNDLTMYTMVDLPVARTMRAMTSLTSHRILRDAGSHLEFANEFIRGQCYVGTAAPLRRMLHGLVAERLLLADGGDEAIPGLEIAWHLVRADRLHEAIPFLLAGGKESIRRGAPHEADLALSTGLPALTGQPRRTAILLLAEAQQELGRWADSLRLLDEAREAFSESEECCREVLRIVARRWSGHLEDAELTEAGEALCNIASTTTDVDVQLKALCAMPFILTATRDASAISEFGRCLSEVRVSTLDEYQRIQLLLARAWCEDQVRNDVLARELIDEAIQLVDNTETASSIAVRVFVGGGMLRVEHGDYSSAVPMLERAARMARQIDNRVHLSAAAAGLAIAHGRLGNVTLQLDWANIALGCLRADDWGIIAISAAYEKALALALDDRFTEACVAVRELDHRFAKRRPAWATQAWHLVKADILALAGNSRGAFAAATNGASGKNGRLLLNDFAGLHARWQSLLARRDGTERATLAALREQAKAIGNYHAKDRAEVLAAIAMLEDRAGEDAAGTWTEVEAQLERLPKTVTTVMRRLGTLR